jgi:hypothetical protein
MTRGEEAGFCVVNTGFMFGIDVLNGCFIKNIKEHLSRSLKSALSFRIGGWQRICEISLIKHEELQQQNKPN